LIESDSRLSYLARELLAIEAWEAGQPDLARDQLENLTLAFDAPEPVRQRAHVALSVIGPAQTSSADGAPAPAPSEGETKRAVGVQPWPSWPQPPRSRRARPSGALAALSLRSTAAATPRAKPRLRMGASRSSPSNRS